MDIMLKPDMLQFTLVEKAINPIFRKIVIGVILFIALSDAVALGKTALKPCFQ